MSLLRRAFRRWGVPRLQALVYRGSPSARWLLGHFGAREIDRVYTGHGDFNQRRGWILWGEWVYYDEEWG